MTDARDEVTTMSDELNNDELQTTGEAEQASSESEMTEALAGGGEESFVVTDEKKPINRTSLVLFVVVALGGGGLYLMHLRTGPKSAEAAPQTVQANQTITQFLSGGNTNLKTMEQMLRNTQKIVQQFLAYPSVNQVPLGQLKTNPFRQTSAKDGETASEADARKKRDDDKAAARRTAEGFQLQSILHGTRKACMINNTMCVEGQQIEGFVIEKINPSSVIVRSGTFRFELQMQK
jgi:hypothetical protein